MPNPPQSPANKRKPPLQNALIAAGVFIFLAGAAQQLFSATHLWPAFIRDAALLLLAIAAVRQRSLTSWIFFAMLLGLEIGLDHPQFAEHLRFLSEIFLRLIKVIVAPLILATLITGIAGHDDLKSVGRIGIKSLIYFEVVTTIALFLGVGAINLTRAGEGLAVTQSTGTPSASALSSAATTSAATTSAA